MIRSLLCKALFAICLVPCGILSACGSAPHSEQSAQTGKFSMPLLATAGTHTYRLQGALYVSGPSYQFFDLGSDASVVSANLPTGSYGASLYSWTLTRDDGSAQFVPVSAALVSSSVAWFSIFNQTTTTISFQFETDGQIVTVGAGQLNVAISVHESPLVCTPLGTGCPDQSWCAPTELTGAPLQCISSGSVAIGAGCTGPNDCVQNSSCFDLAAGSGPVCLQLCTSAQFDQPCGTAGLCTPRGNAYGVCEPNPSGNGAAGAAGDSGQ